MVLAGKMAAVASQTSLESAPRIFRLVAECSRSRARAGELQLPHGPVVTPVFMPVGTQATMKGITAEQLDALGCRICLGNTYHLGLRPVGGLCPSKVVAELGEPWGIPKARARFQKSIDKRLLSAPSGSGLAGREGAAGKLVIPAPSHELPWSRSPLTCPFPPNNAGTRADSESPRSPRFHELAPQSADGEMGSRRGCEGAPPP